MKGKSTKGAIAAVTLTAATVATGKPIVDGADFKQSANQVQLIADQTAKKPELETYVVTIRLSQAELMTQLAQRFPKTFVQRGTQLYTGNEVVILADYKAGETFKLALLPGGGNTTLEWKRKIATNYHSKAILTDPTLMIHGLLAGILPTDRMIIAAGEGFKIKGNPASLSLTKNHSALFPGSYYKADSIWSELLTPLISLPTC